MMGDLALAFGFVLMLIGGFIGYWIGRMHEPECPRMILGYNCKGETCDHSEKTLQEAQWAMMKRQINKQ